MIPVLFLFNDWALFLLRIILGVVLIAHGLPKLKGLKRNALKFEKAGFKPGVFWGTAIALFEVVGGLLIMVGLLTQLVSALAFIQFLIIVVAVRRSSPFKKSELDFVMLASLAIIATSGAGVYSIDSLLRLFLY